MQDLDRDLEIVLAYQGEEGPKASIIGNLGQQVSRPLILVTHNFQL